MDFGKFKYEAALKAREARKNQVNTVIKEIKLRPKIDPHDYGTKKGHVERFLKAGDKVKVTIMFRGREQSRPELGFRLLQRLAEDVTELGFVESPEAGRPQHDHGARPDEEEGRGQGRGRRRRREGRAEPQQVARADAAVAGRRPSRDGPTGRGQAASPRSPPAGTAPGSPDAGRPGTAAAPRQAGRGRTGADARPGHGRAPMYRPPPDRSSTTERRRRRPPCRR